jgi:large subunit ribosomal protein L25
MEQSLTLNVEKREALGKGACRKIRRAGRLPGVIYGLGSQHNVTLDPKLIKKYLLQAGGQNIIFKLQGDGIQGQHALIKDYLVDPVSRELLHADLLEIDINKKIEVTVAINITGKAVGVTEGGVLNIIERTVKIKCLPFNIPKHVDIDVTNLKIGASIHLDELVLPAGIEKVSQQNITLVTVVPPTKEEELAPVLTQAAEPEVITEKKKDDAEGAEAGKDAKKEEKKEDK